VTYFKAPPRKPKIGMERPAAKPAAKPKEKPKEKQNATCFEAPPRKPKIGPERSADELILEWDTFLTSFNNSWEIEMQVILEDEKEDVHDKKLDPCLDPGPSIQLATQLPGAQLAASRDDAGLDDAC
jgi:hypothetical protein